MTDIKSGDWVRITIEGPWPPDNYTTEDIKALDMIGIMPEDTVTVEKIDPPVETFKPGDRLRRHGMGYEVTLGHDGYLHHVTNRFERYANSDNRDFFTSRNFDKVTLG